MCTLLHERMKALIYIICILINHVHEHILNKLGETVKRQNEISEKGWEGRKVVQIPNEWRRNLHGALSPTWWWPWWYSPPQCRELHSELDNLSDEYLSCLRKLQHCREELNQSQKLPPRVRALILSYSTRRWWDYSSSSQIWQIKFISPCQHLTGLCPSASFILTV